ncbi:MAG: hypothetical protein A3K03_10665 [Bdellovibrionales bacterium RIFOXYD1_FULL_44_7]|nr:MAG: hypothetical protein A3K03_10665 [Bdellovibrionales bacterium RIFOXYD1_FULL_44_7]
MLRALSFLSIILVVLFVASCGKPQEEENTGCLQPDQAATLMPSLDIESENRITIDSSFTVEQRESMLRAIATWNNLGRSLTGKDFFTGKVSEVPSSWKPAGDDGCEFQGSSKDSFAIIRETSAETWKAMNLTDRNGGATVRCTVENQLTRQVILINTNHNKVEQFHSVVLHELGHAIGLDHSCLVGTGRLDFTSCGSLGADHPYRVATMYPLLTISTDFIETKEDLRSNDSERASCLYKP